jgi:hypothetical protein
MTTLRSALLVVVLCLALHVTARNVRVPGRQLKHDLEAGIDRPIVKVTQLVDEPEWDPKVDRFELSLNDACEKDAGAMCPNRNIDIAFCLSKRLKEVRDPQCKYWMANWKACETAVRAMGCTEDVLQCIMMEPGMLGKECANENNQFFKSVMRTE